MSEAGVERRSVSVDRLPASYLTAGQGPVVLMLHGTYWSRVWLPALPDVAAAGLCPVAVDLPGFGCSGGELTLETATVPRLSEWVSRFFAALGVGGPVNVVGHDIGVAIAQHLLVARPGGITVRALALVNAVTYDSWPVPSVARFRDPAVVAATSPEDLIAARRQAITAGLARPASEEELADYLAPLTDPRVARSWMALAGAAHGDYAQHLVAALRESTVPKLLVWGEDDPFQRIEYAERFAADIPRSRLVRVPGAGHIPMENAPATVARELTDFFNDPSQQAG
jgi:pimeloyl-ACP methyl ester carboxylesterase